MHIHVGQRIVSLPVCFFLFFSIIIFFFNPTLIINVGWTKVRMRRGFAGGSGLRADAVLIKGPCDVTLAARSEVS